MTSYTSSSELDPETTPPTDVILIEPSGSNLPTPLTGWDELPPPPRPPQVAWWVGRIPGRSVDGEPLPVAPPARFFSPPFRIG